MEKNHLAVALFNNSIDYLEICIMAVAMQYS